MPTPMQRHTLLQRHIDRGVARVERLSQADARFSSVRLAVALGGGTAAAVAWGVSPAASAGVLLLTALVFFALVRWHGRVRSRFDQQRRWLTIKQRHLARATFDWEALPPPFISDADPTHPFEVDLDLVGERSLHHLLDTTSTIQGGHRLLSLLREPLLDPAAIRERQQLIAELSPRFCDRVARIGGGAAVGKRRPDMQRILDWVAAPDVQDVSGRFVALLAALCVMTVLLGVAERAGFVGPLYLLSFSAYLLLSVSKSRAVQSFWHVALDQQEVFTALGSTLAFLERTPTHNKPRLRALLQPYHGDHRPSRLLRSLLSIIAAGGLQANPIIWITVNALLPWDIYHAYRLSQVRQLQRERLPVWLDVWHQIEALAALRLFAYLHPDYPLPTLTAHGGLHAEQIGHPLIAADRRVCNDFTLTERGQVVLITGSNMSGKSSFLRTVGINLVLAQAGAVVCARSLTLEPFRLFSCIRISDSLAEGYSYFYAEVRRLRALLDALVVPAPQPMFFLIDEIFKGTNNRERLTGSRAYIRALIGKNGLGLISTHDLELASIDGLHNYHFTDRVDGGALSFDYQLRPGVSPSTNALRIMAMEGLPTD